MNTALGRCSFDEIIQPISGRAVELRSGEVLRITQVEGQQCVDLNFFNLHDYKERMSVGHMRAQGIRLKRGHIVVSAPPRNRAMLAIIHISEACITDLLGARCTATSGEIEFGLVPRTNCQDALAEAIREYGLAPDDVHDSFNLWMHSIWDDTGSRSLRNVGPKGDYVDLLALMDVLAVPVTCGSGDISQVSNFGFKPIRVQIFGSTEQTVTRVRQYLDRCGGYKSQLSRSDFSAGKIRTERQIRADPSGFPTSDLTTAEQRDIEVDADQNEIVQLRQLMTLPRDMDDAAVVRAAFLLWYQRNRAKPHWLSPDGPGCCCD